MSGAPSINRRDALLATAGLLTALSGCQSKTQETSVTTSEPESPPDEQAIRDANIATLTKLGFTVAGSLPSWSKWTGKPISLRPKIEICRRLMCSEVATAYIWSQTVPEENLRAYIKRSQLMDSMAEVEHKIFATPREDAAQQFGNGDGWRQENQWGLAWVLGFDIEPGLTDGFITEKVMTPLVKDFMPALDDSDKDFADRVQLRSLNEVFRKFDILYCAHNAVRSAQLGKPNVPDNFDSTVDGGVIHEKRHSLTWCVSPGVKWDDTDLST